MGGRGAGARPNDRVGEVTRQLLSWTFEDEDKMILPDVINIGNNKDMLGKS